jgi:hypothetical protein
VRFLLEGESFSEINSDVELEPGQEAVLHAPEDLDLSALRDYLLEAVILSDTLALAGNNSLRKKVSHYAWPDLALSLPEIQSEQGDFADLYFLVDNRGNNFQDSLHFLLTLNSSFSREGVLEIGLQPGESIRTVLPLAGMSHPLDPGTYEVDLALLGADSVVADNQLSITLQWYPLGEAGTDKALPEIWPNPAGGYLHMRFAAPWQGESIEIIDALGRLQARAEIPEGRISHTVSLRDLEPGSYWLRTHTTGKILGSFIRTGSTP